MLLLVYNQINKLSYIDYYYLYVIVDKSQLNNYSFINNICLLNNQWKICFKKKNINN